MKKTEIEWVNIDDVALSPLNPRKHPSAAGMAELKASLRDRGFAPELSHLLVRPDPAGEVKYELVCGERRWRAARELAVEGALPGLVPVVVAALADAEVLELQLVENLQREDLTPMDEAFGLRALLDLRGPDGRATHTPESLAEKLGRSARDVRRLLTLCRLRRGSAAAAAVDAGKISAAHGLLLAQVPAAGQRDELLERVLRPAHGGGPISAKELERMIAEEYVAELSGADFLEEDAVAELVPVVLDADGARVAGGRCEDCPHNSRNMPGAEKSRKHKCANVECFRAKRAAAYQRWADAVSEPEKKRLALPREEAEEVWDHSGVRPAWNSPYVDLQDVPEEHLLSPAAPERPPKWQKILRGTGVPVALAKDAAGKVHELVERNLAVEAARLAEAAKAEAERLFRAPPQKAAETAQEREEGWRAQVEKTATDDRVYVRIVQAISLAADTLGWSDEALRVEIGRLLCAAVADNGWLDALARCMGWPEEGSRAEIEELAVEDLKNPAHAVGTFAALAIQNAAYLPTPEKDLRGLAEAVGVDIAAVRKAALEDLKREKAAAAAETEKAVQGGVKWAAPQGEDGAELHCGEVILEEAWGVSGGVALRHDAHWLAAHNASGADWSEDDVSAVKYDTRELALRAALLGVKQAFKKHEAPPAAVARINEYLALIGKEPKAKAKRAAK